MMEFTWKKTVDDAYLFEQETRKQYEQHIKLKNFIIPGKKNYHKLRDTRRGSTINKWKSLKVFLP